MSLDEQYKTGVLWQDFQHGELIAQVFKLRAARENDEGEDEFWHSVIFLSMYVHHHFKLEDEYMAAYKYPNRAQHAKEHKSFIKQLREFRTNYKDYSKEAVNELLTKLNDWILSHIFKDDKILGSFILKMEDK